MDGAESPSKCEVREGLLSGLLNAFASLLLVAKNYQVEAITIRLAAIVVGSHRY